MNTYAVGDEVGYVRYASMHHTLVSHGVSRIVKINHHGHILLENGKQFDRHGHERKVQYGGHRLIAVDQLRAQIAEVAANRMRVQAAQELVKLIEGQRDGFGRQHQVTEETRARMLGLINEL